MLHKIKKKTFLKHFRSKAILDRYTKQNTKKIKQNIKKNLIKNKKNNITQIFDHISDKICNLDFKNEIDTEILYEDPDFDSESDSDFDLDTLE